MEKYFLNEIWLPIKGFEGVYEVSNMGQIRSKDRIINHPTGKAVKRGSILRQFEHSKNGYMYVSLCKDGKPKSYLVHRLVAEAFIPNPENKPCVDHINGIRTDCRVENLRWVTHEENCANPLWSVHLRTKEWASKISKSKCKTVEQYDLDGVLIQTYSSTKEAGKALSVHPENIARCCRNECHTAYGFMWRY